MCSQEEGRLTTTIAGFGLDSSPEKMDVEAHSSQQEPVDRFRASNLYDRQIRLWGWEAQQRLMKSRLLMYGMNGVGAEVLKNLMLGGIREITIVDSAVVQELDLSTNFFLRREDFGLNRAYASRGRAQLLNQTCTLVAVEKDSQALTEDLVKAFDLVALNSVSVEEAVRIGAICRRLGVPVFVSEVLGFHAFYVNDLNGLQFEVPPLAVEKPAGSEPKPPAKRVFDPNGPSTSRRAKDADEDTVLDESQPVSQESVQLDISAPDLATILTRASARRSGLASPLPRRFFGLKRIDPYLNLEVILAFVGQKARYPSFEHLEADLKTLEDILTEVRPEGDTRVVELGEMLRPVANFTCAIFGGTLAQEMITVLTRRGYPIFNLYYLAAMDAMGSREYLE